MSKQIEMLQQGNLDLRLERNALRLKLREATSRTDASTDAADALATAVARAKACAHYLTPEILDALRKYREAEGR